MGPQPRIDWRAEGQRGARERQVIGGEKMLSAAVGRLLAGPSRMERFRYVVDGAEVCVEVVAIRSTPAGASEMLMAHNVALAGPPVVHTWEANVVASGAPGGVE